MKNKRIVFTLTISLLLTACGGSDVTPSEPTPSESFTPSVLPTPSEPTSKEIEYYNKIVGLPNPKDVCFSSKVEFVKPDDMSKSKFVFRKVQ